MALVRHAAVASQLIDQARPKDKLFYTGKIASAHFYTANILPQLTLTRKLVEQGSLDVMDMDDACFG